MKMVINNALSIERKTETIIYFVAPSKSLPATHFEWKRKEKRIERD
jgi:hypothetical protein